MSGFIRIKDARKIQPKQEAWPGDSVFLPVHCRSEDTLSQEHMLLTFVLDSFLCHPVWPPLFWAWYLQSLSSLWFMGDIYGNCPKPHRTLWHKPHRYWPPVCVLSRCGAQSNRQNAWCARCAPSFPAPAPGKETSSKCLPFLSVNLSTDVKCSTPGLPFTPQYVQSAV